MAAEADLVDENAARITELRQDEASAAAMLGALKNKTGKVADEHRKIFGENLKAIRMQIQKLRRPRESIYSGSRCNVVGAQWKNR